MIELISQTSKLLGVPELSFRECAGGDIYVTLPEDQFREAVYKLSEEFNLISLFCVQNFSSHQGFTLFYAFEKAGCPQVLVITRPLAGAETTSVARRFASASWYEREISDGFGITFTNAYDDRKLFLHEAYQPGFHPLLKSFRNQPVTTRKDILPGEEYRFRELKGEGIYQIPVGPVHAGIIEPGHFRFSVIGETIFNLEIRMFYKHRGVEKLAEGKTPQDCVAVAESISGDESAANAVAFCAAVEKISGIRVPLRAWQLRTIFLEMERIYSHLGDMAGMITDVAYPVGATGFYVLREEVLRQNAALTGSRFLKNAVCIGGVRRDLQGPPFEQLSDYFRSYTSGFRLRLREALEMVHRSPSVIDRLETTGIIRKGIAQALHVTGPAARASGIDTDTRIDHPYGIYPGLPLSKRALEKGDVVARFELKASEILDSVNLINHFITAMEPGEVLSRAPLKDGFAFSLVEAPRGQTVQWVYIKNGLIDRYKVRTASFCNWSAIEHAVMGNIVPDFPLINKSLNLSYAGTDL